nr:hypothetical protein [uncultured Pedobacter sp.]
MGQAAPLILPAPVRIERMGRRMVPVSFPAAAAGRSGSPER